MASHKPRTEASGQTNVPCSVVYLGPSRLSHGTAEWTRDRDRNIRIVCYLDHRRKKVHLSTPGLHELREIIKCQNVTVLGLQNLEPLPPAMTAFTLLDQQFSNSGPWTSSINIAWHVPRLRPRPTESEMMGRASDLCLNNLSTRRRETQC